MAPPSPSPTGPSVGEHFVMTPHYWIILVLLVVLFLVMRAVARHRGSE